MYVCTYVCMYACIYIHICTYTCVYCMCIYLYICGALITITTIFLRQIVEVYGTAAILEIIEAPIV